MIARGRPSNANGQGKELALFGTSADPPTRGHRAFLQGLSERYPRVITWASDNPLKRHEAPLAIRTALLQAVVDDLDHPGLGLDQRLSHRHALTTLDRAAELHPRYRLVFVVGSDLLPQIPRWYEAEKVLQRCRLGVVPRAGWRFTENDLMRIASLGGSMERLDLRIPATASSSVRAHPDSAMVPRELWGTLREQDLYGWNTIAEAHR